MSRTRPSVLPEEPKPPRMPDEAPAGPLDESLLDEDGRLDLRERRLAGGGVPGLELHRGGLQDAVLTQCNLANLRARDASFVRVELRGCRLTGLSWAAGVWRDVLVADCRADLSGLRHAALERVTFRDCDLTEVDLVESRLRHVRFERCRLAGADVRDARFERCQMRECDLAGLRGAESLRGVSMPWSDVVAAAGLMAAALGIRISED